jgi:hypothetical protein
MNRRHLTIAVCAALWAAPVVAAAGQTMYRCGNKYQDLPCESGEGGRIGKTSSAPQAHVEPQGRSAAQFQTEADAAECSTRGQDSLKISWAREAGATAEKQTAEVDSKGVSSRQAAYQKRLIASVYEKRGSSVTIRSQIEGECMAEREKIRQAQTLAAAASKLMQDVPADAAPSKAMTTDQQTIARSSGDTSGPSRAEEEHKRTCSQLSTQLSSVRSEQRSGTSPSRANQLNDSRRELETALRKERC